MNKTKQKIAVKWEVRIEGDTRSIQLFDRNDRKVEGSNAFWSGNFDCSSNQLTSLQGAPETVGGSFYCSLNQLTSLQGAPETVGGDFYCGYNQLTSLQGAPETVGGDFYCGYNKLTSLQGAPETVGGGFDCHSNQLTSLQGAPETVGGGFNCGYNQLTSLQGAPETVGGDFYCHSNQLTSLQGAPTSEPRKATKKVFAFFLKKKYLLADGVLTKLISKKKTGNVTVYKTSKLAGNKTVYVIKKGEIFSHGKTVKEAKASLIYKITDRDTSKFKTWKLNDIKTLPQLIEAYRVITGACEFGVKDFVESAKLPKKMSVAKAIELTKNKYNSQKFKEFFTK